MASTLKADKNGIITLSFLLLPEYAMISLLSAIEPLRIANRLAGKELYRWQCFSKDGLPVTASNLMMLQNHLSIDQPALPDNLIVNASFHPEKYCDDAPTIKWLRKLQHNGSNIGALDTGCFILANAGILDDLCITMHWEAIPVYKEQYPLQKISSDLFVIDKHLMTCAGGTAASDMILHLIGLDHGQAFVLKICDQFIKKNIRQHSDHQQIDLAKSLNIHHPRLLNVLRLMSINITNPMSLDALASCVHISLRQLERLFKQHFSCTAKQYYLRLRLERAQQLLDESELNIYDIAMITGFNSSSHFCRCYRSHFSITPTQQRSL